MFLCRQKLLDVIDLGGSSQKAFRKLNTRGRHDIKAVEWNPHAANGNVLASAVSVEGEEGGREKEGKENEGGTRREREGGKEKEGERRREGEEGRKRGREKEKREGGGGREGERGWKDVCVCMCACICVQSHNQVDVWNLELEQAGSLQCTLKAHTKQA